MALLRKGWLVRPQLERLFSTSSRTLSLRQAGVQSTRSGPTGAFLSCPIEDQREDRVLALRNSRLEEVQLTAALLEKFSLLHVSSAAVPEIKCPTLPSQQTDYQAPAKDTLKSVVFDINPGLAIEEPGTFESSTKVIDDFVRKEKLHCHRLLIIRKKKMKVHRRKRLWKRMWSIWRKRFAQRFKKRELEFRGLLTAKVNEAKKFEPATYVKEYLDDLHFELIPKTYKGGRKPQWLVKELLEADKRNEERLQRNQTDLVTKKKLIGDNETVDKFVERFKK